MGSQKSNQHATVLIVGAGFSGLVAALLAKKLNLPCYVIEKQQRDYHGQSNAHYLNAHTLEILVSLGISMSSLQAVAIDPDVSCRMVVCHRLNRTLHAIDLVDEATYRDRFQRVGRHGAHLNVRGKHLYALLLQALDRQQIEVHWATSLVALDKKNKQALLSIASKTKIFCAYEVLLACDGAGSQVRQCMHVSMRKSHFMDFLTIECHGSIVPYCEDKAMLYWIFNERLTACMVAFDPGDLQVLQVPLLQNQNVDEIFSSIRLSFAAICGVDPRDLTHTFQSSGTWRCQTGLVEQCDVVNDGIYLLGDAWHQVLPAGGMGLNLAIADAYNLIWKLAADRDSCERFWSESYVPERHVIAKVSVSQSVSNFLGFLQMGAALFPHFLHGNANWLSLLSRQPMSQMVQSTWLLGQRLLHDSSGRICDQFQKTCEKNRGHFDGIAMHQPKPADSFLVYGATKRCLYDLAILPHSIDVGKPLQHFPICVSGQEKFFSDFLDYDSWAFFAYDGHCCSGFLDKLTVSCRLITLTYHPSCPLHPGEILMVRPDRIVFALVDANDLSAWCAFMSHCKKILLLIAD